MAEKKLVKFNVKNLKVFDMVQDEDGKYTYANMLAVPGTVAIQLEAQSGEFKFYADGINYFSKFSNNGYEGTINNANLPDEFRTRFLGDIKLEDGILIEVQDAEQKEFGMTFEIDTSKGPVRYQLYNCLPSRPSSEHNTTEEEISVATDEIKLLIKAIPIGNKNIVKAKIDSTNAKFESEKDKLYVPESLTPTP